MGTQVTPYTSNCGSGFGLATCNHGKAILEMGAHILSHLRAGIASATSSYSMIIPDGDSQSIQPWGGVTSATSSLIRRVGSHLILNHGGRIASATFNQHCLVSRRMGTQSLFNHGSEMASAT